MHPFNSDIIITKEINHIMSETETMKDYEQEIEESLANAPDEGADDPTWLKLQQMRDNKEVFKVKIKGIVPKGVIAYVEEIRGFIPASQISISYIEDTNKLLGQTLEVVIITADREKMRLVMSGKEVEIMHRNQKKEAKLSSLNVGDIIEGKVESIMPYGAFIELGDGLSGLVHISQIALKRISSPADVLKEGQIIKAKITKIDEGKVSLSMKALIEDDGHQDASSDKASKKSVEYISGEAVSTSLSGLLSGIKLNG